MNHKKTDRRVGRTRKLIQDALIPLILEKGYQKVTVQDIIDRANVGRSTFYAHFKDKEDLFESGFTSLAHELQVHVHLPAIDDDNKLHLVHSIDFFRHADENRALYKALVEGGGREVLVRIARDHMEKQIEAHLETFPLNETAPPIPLPILTNYLASTLHSLISYWLEKDLPYTAEELDEMFCTLTMPGIEKLMEGR